MARSSRCDRNIFQSSGSISPGNDRRRFFCIPKIVVVCAFALLLPSIGTSLLPASSDAAPSAGPEKVFIIPVRDTIDMGLAFFIKRALEEAERSRAALVILDVNTFGGRVDAAVDIRDALDDCSIPTTAYVNKRAISAGALICLATKTIAMAPGSTIGAATPVGLGPAGEKLQLGEKEVSYVRGEFRATAERNGHSPLLAEAMVDADTEALAVFENEKLRLVSRAEADELRATDEMVKIEEISAKGKLLTMTVSEAVRVGLAGSMPDSLDELISELGLDPAEKIVAEISWSEYIVRFLTHPIVSGLLLTFGVLGIFFELQMPSWGVSGTVGAACLVLFFGGHYIAGLASFSDMLLFAVGLGLLAAEILVVPGFGITGVSGLLCILAGIYLALVKRPVPQFSWDYQVLNTAMATFFFSAVAVIIGAVIIWKMSPESRIKKLMVLSASEQAKDGYTASESLEALVGRQGMSLSHLRPAGRALIGGEPFEVQSEGEFIEKDRALTVVRVAGNKVFVTETEKGATA